MGRVRIDQASVDRLIRRIERAVTTDLPMRRATDLVEAKSVELAPVDTGNLEASFVQRITRTAGRIVSTFGFSAPYAANVHELPKHARGPRTRRKPGNEFGPAGPSYLLRAVRGLVLSGRLGRLLADEYREVLDRD